MPSGDSGAGGIFCFIFGVYLQMPYFFLCLPLVMCGRVYYQCHWFADTIVGALIGCCWGALMMREFNLTVPLLELFSGAGSFELAN